LELPPKLKIIFLHFYFILFRSNNQEKNGIFTVYTKYFLGPPVLKDDMPHFRLFAQ